MFIIFIPVYMFLLIPILMVIAGETRGFLRAAGTLQWGLMTAVFALSHAGYLFMLPTSRAEGAGLVLYLVMLTELNDVFQYLWGKALGRRRIVPTVSPNKTWEGFIGGLLSTMVLSSILAPFLTPLGRWGAVWFGMMIATAGFFGDLAMSALKRDLNIKDTSEYIPGHGGVLDRVDSLTYTAPLFFHVLRHFYF
jgi:phosphatidate cytidylyltransferase